MALNLKSLSFNANNPLHLAHFWADALGWKVNDKTSGKIELVPTDGTRFTVVFHPSSEKKLEKNRLHLDLTTTSINDQTETIERLIKHGARHIDIGQSPDEPHVVLADPEGNELCIINPENEFLADCGRFGSITCDGSQEVGYFWSKALGWPLVWDQDEETAIRAPDGTGPLITWGGGTVATKVGKNRLYLEVAPVDGDQPAEVDRLISLGAKLVGTNKSNVDGSTMTDPDGNEFRVLKE